MLKEIAEAIASKGGRAYYVGGYVRDQLLGIENKDIDVEVLGISAEELIDVLSEFGKVELFGKSFEVFKVGKIDADFCLPRCSYGDHALDQCNPNISTEQACKRRDFTINAMMQDILSEEIIDCYGGKADLSLGMIRHVDDESFVEDPLRVYRAFQFAARFSFRIADETCKLMKNIDLSGIPRERIYEEFRKLLLEPKNPSIGFRYMQQMGILDTMHPLLAQMVGCLQEPRHHPEGDVWNHTLLVLDQAAGLKKHASNQETFMWAALLHDIGKPCVTNINEHGYSAYGHDHKGEELAREFLQGLTGNKELQKETAVLVREHMKPLLFYKDQKHISNGALRRLARRVNIHDILLLAEADHKGRDGEYGIERFEAIRDWFTEKIASLKLDEIVEPCIQGRDLINMGYKTGPHFGEVLRYALELQLDGLPTEEIYLKVKSYMLERGFDN
ncbi:trna nucleotidyltransferase [hydrocarbon metagenome]|uniref:Trna nucleotidyltransferase n=1 Tax=hydrocarbon metagenome TaxID=938273 RepID=A0A0W8E2K2_9ZZZZ